MKKSTAESLAPSRDIEARMYRDAATPDLRVFKCLMLSERELAETDFKLKQISLFYMFKSLWQAAV